MKLIDKDAALAEIEELKTAIDIKLRSSNDSAYWIAQKLLLERLKGKINSLEVKEVDLDFMLHEYWDLSSKITIDCLESATMTKDEMINFAKHFFELGLKAQKGE